LALQRTDTRLAARPPADAATARSGGLLGTLNPRGLPWLIAFAVAGAYIVLFLVRLSHNLNALGWSPSTASAFVMPETLVKTGPGGHTVMGSSPQWASLWFGLLTAWLPLHRELWSIAPTLMFVLTACIVGWSVDQLAGRRAAVLAVLIGVIASPMALAFFMAPFSHNTVYPCTALLGAYLIWLTRGRGRKLVTTVLVPPVLGVIVGACLSSDLLLASTAVIPLGLTAMLAGLRRNRESRLVALSALSTVVVSIPVALFTSSTMKSLGYLTLSAPIKYATLAELVSVRAELLFRGLKILFNGYLGTGAPGTLHVEFGIASVVVMSIALLALLIVGIRTSVRFIGSGLRRDASQEPIKLARSLHILYWVISAATSCGAFWIAGEGSTTTHESYYATVIFSVAAVIPLLLASGRVARVLIPAAASVFFAASLVGLTADYLNVAAATARAGATVSKIAAANHLQVGYSNFGDASGITWSTNNRVIVRPVEECLNTGGTNLCPGFQAYVPSWYVPYARHTFLLVDSIGIEVRALPSGLGKPIATHNFGTMQMYIYPYDIASRFGRSW
jgi:hypothetical protein